MGLTQEKLGGAIHKSRSTMGNIEQTGQLTQENLDNICKVFKMTQEQIENYTSEPVIDYTVIRKREEEKDREIARLKKENEAQKTLIEHQGAQLAWINKKQKEYYLQNNVLEKKLKSLERKYGQVLKKYGPKAKSSNRKRS
jgi:transcriptional regulator with XRE-family HTH domain